MRNGRTSLLFCVAVVVASVAVVIWGVAVDTPTDSKRELAQRRSISRVETISVEIRFGVKESGEYPAMPRSAQSFLRPDVKPDRQPPLTDGWGQLPRLLVEQGRVVGAYSVGEDGVDSRGGGDDISCRA